MPTTIATVEDLMRALDTNPELLEAMRSRLLTRELLDMPRTLAVFIENTDRRFESVDRQFESVDRRFESVDRRFESVDRRFESLDRRVQRIEDRTGLLVGAYARNEALREVVVLSREMGMARMRRIWSFDEVDALVRSRDTTGISVDDLRSFRRADAIVEAVDGQGGTNYIAVEVSFTVNGRDTTRAIRNADYMTRFTSQPCLPAVMGVRLDERVRRTVESGEVYWYRLDPQLLEVD